MCKRDGHVCTELTLWMFSSNWSLGGASLIHMSTLWVARSAHVPRGSLGFLCVTPCTYAPPLPLNLGCCVCPNHHHHHYEVNHQNGLKTKEKESPTQLQGFIPNGAFIGALHLNMDGNSHRYTGVLLWCVALLLIEGHLFGQDSSLRYFTLGAWKLYP